jgi:hypothetical protein
MAAAVERTGLEDFGDDSFREGLEILVRALAEEARLNARGEGFVYHRIAGHLAQRLQVEDTYLRHPEIDDAAVEAPLFGIGLPRTGSTALSFLLAQDSNVRYLRSREAAQPCPPTSTVHGDDPRIPAGEQKVVAGSRHHVPQDTHGPMECLDLMAPWLTRLQPLGEDVSVVLETADGTVRIEGETVVSTHDITDPSEVPADQLAKLANWTFPALQQAGVRYRWDGEETYGMLERSIPMDKIER